MARHPKGTTPKLTNKLIGDVVTLIVNGNYVETAAAACGISKDTLYRWLRLAHSSEATPLVRKLSDAVVAALALSETRDVGSVNDAIKGGDWRAAAWRLERRFSSRWGKLTTQSCDTQLKLNNQTGEWCEKIQLDQLTDEELDEKIESLRAKLELTKKLV
jgi:transposase